jgi:hypothetical protein
LALKSPEGQLESRALLEVAYCEFDDGVTTVVRVECHRVA